MRLPRKQQEAIQRLAEANGGKITKTRLESPREAPRALGEVVPGCQVLAIDDWLPLGTNAMIRHPRAK